MPNFQYILNEGYNKKNIFESARDGYLFCKKKKFYDLSFGSGTLLLGHNNNILQSSLKSASLKNLNIISTPNLEAVKYSNLLKKFLPTYSKFIFCNSGAEAISKTIRLANAISNKNLIISVTGSWHGSVDRTLFSSKKDLKPYELSSGLNSFNKKNIKFIPYNNISESKKILNRNKKKISCILIEPLQASLPQLKIKNYLKFLEKYSKKNNIILVFDEMVTGIRFNGKCVQQFFNIKPHISTFGKCFGGGLPIGIIALNKDILKKMNKLKKKVFFGGTFSGNQLSTFTGRKSLEFILKNKKKIFSNLEEKSYYFEKKVYNFIKKEKLRVNFLKVHSIFRIIFSKQIPKNRVERDFLERDKMKLIQKFRNYLLTKKINYPSNGIIFLSYSTTFKDLDYIIKFLNLGLKKFFK
jgi:glutamate-1-semialdehyde 2,1-aminomutase